jgi:hypothetical protein
MRLRDCPPMKKNPPPTKTLPSAWSAIEFTKPFGASGLGSNESAKPVVGSSRAIAWRGCPPIVLKSPLTNILPSGCSTMQKTRASASGLKDMSSVTSALSRAMWLRGTAGPQ